MSMMLVDQGTPIRRPLAEFVRAMEWRLRAKDEERGECGWRDTSLEYLSARAAEELNELADAMVDGNIMKIKDEAADVANFMMMIADAAFHQAAVRAADKWDRQETDE